MTGTPGTPHFGMLPNDQHYDYVDTLDGSQNSDTTRYAKRHFQYNPAAKSRDMSDSEGEAPGQYYVVDDRKFAYGNNHDGYMGGKTNILNVDEFKTLNNMVYSVRIECADDQQKIAGSTERS